MTSDTKVKTKFEELHLDVFLGFQASFQNNIAFRNNLFMRVWFLKVHQHRIDVSEQVECCGSIYPPLNQTSKGLCLKAKAPISLRVGRWTILLNKYNYEKSMYFQYHIHFLLTLIYIFFYFTYFWWYVKL